MPHCKNCKKEHDIEELPDEGICSSCGGLLVESDTEVHKNKEFDQMLDLLQYSNSKIPMKERTLN